MKNILDQRFNRSLVLLQIRAVKPDLSKEKLHALVQSIFSEWIETDDNPEKRPRFFKSKHFKNVLLVSTFSTYLEGEQEYHQFNLRVRGDVIFAIPVSDRKLKELGGFDRTARKLALGGLKEIGEDSSLLGLL